jgi:LmbE family N-acetylglucosaminyl deacetylase
LRILNPAELAGETVLLVAPHPDDEALGCGGTVKLLTAAGARVAVVVMARGDGGVDGGASEVSIDERQVESRRACELLGAEPPLFIGLKSQDIRKAPAEAAATLGLALKGQRFSVLLVPSPLERHATHRACLVAALLADMASEQARWYGYGVWDALPAVRDVVEIDITEARAAKTKAVTAHASQNGPRPLAAGMMSRDLAQAVYSRITGDESRKAVERLMELDGLQFQLPASVKARDAQAVEDAISAWLSERFRIWTEALWAR